MTKALYCAALAVIIELAGIIVNGADFKNWWRDFRAWQFLFVAIFLIRFLVALGVVGLCGVLIQNQEIAPILRHGLCILLSLFGAVIICYGAYTSVRPAFAVVPIFTLALLGGAFMSQPKA